MDKYGYIFTSKTTLYSEKFLACKYSFICPFVMMNLKNFRKFHLATDQTIVLS